jgi:chromosome partitioning protein
LFVINRKITNTAIGRDVVEALKDYPFPVAKTVIHQRVAFAESAAGGLAVSEFDAKGQAAREIKQFVRELLEFH